MLKTNIWEDGVEWNGLVHPATLKLLKPFSSKCPSIKPASAYEGKETGEIVFDIHIQAEKSRQAQTQAIKDIDKIKNIDVPWKTYLCLFGFLMCVATVGCYFAIILLRVELYVIIPIVIAFIIGVAAILALITFEGFREEETRDCYKLSELHNQIKSANTNQLNLVRLDMRMSQMNHGRPQIDQDRSFLLKLNKLRLQSAAFLQLNTAAGAEEQSMLLMTKIMMRLGEIAFFDSKFLQRLYSQMTDVTALQMILTPKEKLDFVREIFSVHILIKKTAERVLGSGKNLIAADNLREVWEKAEAVLQSPKCFAIVAQVSGLSEKEVQIALSAKIIRGNQTLKNLQNVYKNLLLKVPQRSYQNVQEEGDLEMEPIEKFEI